MNEEHSEFLDALRLTGKVNMFGAVPYLMSAFDIKRPQAVAILVEWMENYEE